MKTVLITGANGFIGKNLTEQLGGHYRVLPISRKDADLLDQGQVARLFSREDVDVVIHSATQGTLGRGRESEEKLLKNNLAMFFNLERCKTAYGKLFVLGSGAEYGKQQELSLVGESSFGMAVPSDDYGLSKYAMSKLIEASSNLYNLRLFGIFGPYENYNYRFISNVICKALLGRDIVIHQNVLFDYLYIKDFCKILPWFIEHEPKYHTYNVCTGEKTDIVSIAKEALAQTGSRSTLAVEREGFNKEYTGSNRRMLLETGPVCFTPMKQAVAEMVAYYKDTPFHLEGNY